MAVLVAGDVREPCDEAGEGPVALVVVDDEVLPGEREHPLGDHVVDRHGFDERLKVLGLRRQAVDAGAQLLVEEHLELRVEVLAGRREAILEPLGLQDPDLAVEAVEEHDVARLVGDLGGEEDAHVLVRDGAQNWAELDRDPLLADEEGAQAVHPRSALLGVEPLVPVDPVLREVQVLHRPLLALPQLVELAVREQMGLTAISRLVQGGVARGAEVDAAGPGVGGGLGHERSLSPSWLAGQPNDRPDFRKVLAPVQRARVQGGMSSPRVEFVRRVFEAAERGGPRAGVALLPEEVTWRPFRGGGRVLRSRAELDMFYAEIEREGGRFEPYPTVYEEEGDCVVVSGSARLYSGSSGFKESSLVWVFTFEDDRLVAQCSYATRAEARAAIRAVA